MKIGELARLSGVNASTIRFYEQKGLLPAPKRLASGYRDYDDTTLQRLLLIKFSQRLGFKLEELPGLMKQEAGWDHEQIMDRLKQKRIEIDQLIEQLNNQTDTITSLIAELETHWQQGECMPQAALATLISKANL